MGTINLNDEERDVLLFILDGRQRSLKKRGVLKQDSAYMERRQLFVMREIEEKVRLS